MKSNFYILASKGGGGGGGQNSPLMHIALWFAGAKSNMIPT